MQITEDVKIIKVRTSMSSHSANHSYATIILFLPHFDDICEQTEQTHSNMKSFCKKSRVFIKHWRLENPPATSWNLLAKFHWPVEA